jgi:tetratricopeptide (TPR) repeat protein
MGEVYEALDLELREKVALKTVRPQIAQDEWILERFRREVLLARKVTHPNVCRIFDLFHHRDAHSELDFVTMELLEGETLAARLRRGGPMKTDEALPIARQLAVGLEAAHRAGVVHRDLKSANILLVPNAGGMRAVITDFGLARSTAAGEPLASIYRTGEIVGTPGYMAPEQVEGGAITAAVDIYALGVVLYEMVTGRLPFVGDTPLSTAAKRLTEPPLSPRRHVPDLDPRWERVILRALARAPGDRFQSAADLERAFAGGNVPGGRRRLPSRLLTWAAAIAGLVALPVAAYYSLQRTPELPSAPPAADTPAQPVKAFRRSVAVLGFKNLSGQRELLWLSTALSETLSTELGVGEKLRVIPTETVARIKVDLSLGDEASFSAETLQRMSRSFGADLVVAGSYLGIGDTERSLRLDVRLQDTTTGETIASAAETATVARLFDLISRAGARLREKLGLRELSPAEAGGVRASLPASPLAARLYAEGLQKLRISEALAARDLLERASAADPRHPLIHAALAQAWSLLGYDAKARREAEQAFALSASLTREERLSIEGRYYAMSRQWEKASGIYRSLFTFFPDSVEYGRSLITSLQYLGKSQEALAVVADMRKLPPPLGDDPRIDFAEAAVAESRSDYERKLSSARRAAQKAAAQGSRLLVAFARYHEGTALRELGDPVGALRAFQEAKDGYALAGDRNGVARALQPIGIFFSEAGDLARAEAAYGESLKISREIGSRFLAASALWSLGLFRAIQGDLVGGQRMIEEARADFREVGHTWYVHSSHADLADIRLWQGDVRSALRIYEELLLESRKIGWKELEALALQDQGEALAMCGDIRQARERLGEALGLRERLGTKVLTEDTRRALSAVVLEEGHAAEAEKLARQAAEELERQGSRDREALALAVLARSLAAQGKHAAAREAADRVSPQSRSSITRLTSSITGARLLLARGKAAEAIAPAAAAEAEAARTGFVVYALEARLALGEAEIRAGKVAAGRARLKSLEKEATERGFVLIGRKAARARLGP